MEVKMRHDVDMQWKQLRETVTQPILYTFMIHPKRWGHQVRTWKSPNYSPPVRDISHHYAGQDHHPHRPRNAPPPLTLPIQTEPNVPTQCLDRYSNVSTILSCPTAKPEYDGDWQVREEENSDTDSTSEDSFHDEGVIVNVSAEVHSDAEPVHHPLVPHPPPFLSITEMGDHQALVLIGNTREDKYDYVQDEYDSVQDGDDAVQNVYVAVQDEYNEVQDEYASVQDEYDEVQDGYNEVQADDYQNYLDHYYHQEPAQPMDPYL